MTYPPELLITLPWQLTPLVVYYRQLGQPEICCIRLDGSVYTTAIRKGRLGTMRIAVIRVAGSCLAFDCITKQWRLWGQDWEPWVWKSS